MEQDCAYFCVNLLLIISETSNMKGEISFIWMLRDRNFGWQKPKYVECRIKVNEKCVLEE